MLPFTSHAQIVIETIRVMCYHGPTLAIGRHFDSVIAFESVFLSPSRRGPHVHKGVHKSTNRKKCDVINLIRCVELNYNASIAPNFMLNGGIIARATRFCKE